MSDLLPIGRFAEISGLTAGALRLYDQLDRLRPAMVDFASGYRYFSHDQIETARAIAACGERGYRCSRSPRCCNRRT